MGLFGRNSQKRTPQGSSHSKRDRLVISSPIVTVQSDIDKPVIKWLDSKLNGKKPK